MLLSLILLSYIVASNKDLANTLVSFTTDIPSNSRTLFIIIQMDIETDIPRSELTSTSSNSFRKFFILSIAYANRVQALASSLA